MRRQAVTVRRFRGFVEPEFNLSDSELRVPASGSLTPSLSQAGDFKFNNSVKT